LKDEHDFTGGYTIVKDAVRAWKQSQKEVFLPLTHRPGEAHVDYGFARVWIRGQAEPIQRRKTTSKHVTINSNQVGITLQHRSSNPSFFLPNRCSFPPPGAALFNRRQQFNKIRKQMENGAEDSILSYFTIIPTGWVTEVLRSSGAVSGPAT
jgi:hypothetical protein